MKYTKLVIPLVAMLAFTTAASAQAGYTGCFKYGPDSCPPGSSPPSINMGGFHYGPLAAKGTVASPSPYLPSQGELTVEQACAGTTLTVGQKVLVSADSNGVTIATNGRTVHISANDVSGAGTASVVGYYCGMQDSNDMCTMGMPEAPPVLINGALVYNGFSTSGAMSVGDPLPAGFLVDSSRAIYDLQLFDNGSGIELSGTSFPTDKPVDPSSPGSQEVVLNNCILSK